MPFLIYDQLAYNYATGFAPMNLIVADPHSTYVGGWYRGQRVYDDTLGNISNWDDFLYYVVEHYLNATYPIIQVAAAHRRFDNISGVPTYAHALWFKGAAGDEGAVGDRDALSTQQGLEHRMSKREGGGESRV